MRPRARGRRRGRARRAERLPRRTRRPRDHFVRARVRQMHPLPERPHQPLYRDPRPAGPRLPPGRDRAALARRRAVAAFHGHLDVRRVHRDAGDRAREGQSRGAARWRLHLRLRPLDRPGRGDVHGAGRARCDRRGVRLRTGRARRRRRRAPAGRRPDRGRRPVRGSPADGTAPRRHRHASGRPRGGRPDQGDDRRLRRRLHLRGHRQRGRHARRGVSRP